MDFPDESLAQTAELHRFRQQGKEETIESFRSALADHVKSIDFIESMEIRTGKGWDKFSELENMDMLNRLNN